MISYSGEEAEIVIISLVRNVNPGNPGIEGSIGFLKSNNRTNVLLSRAKHGMYLLGNADLMAKESAMWNEVIQILSSRDQVGLGLPTVCDRHPESMSDITHPEMFEEVFPDGGCLIQCDKPLGCGHLCKYFKFY